MILFIALVATT